MKQEELTSWCLENSEDFCDEILQNSVDEVDFYTVFADTYIINFSNFTFIIYIFLITSSLLYICSYLSNKIILIDLVRENYNKIKHKLLFNSYKPVIILPLVTIVVFIVICIYTKGVSNSYAILNGTTGWSQYTLYHPYLFMSLYLLNLIIHSILYINIALCITRKFHKFLISLILSFLTFIGIEFILEVVFDIFICSTILKSGLGILFNIMNLFAFNDSLGIISPLIVPTILMIISSICVYKMYVSKEKLILDLEA